MPNYDYKCPQCELEMELRRPIADTTPVLCPECDAEMAIQFLNPAAVAFKGTGFYQTDYHPAREV